MLYDLDSLHDGIIPAYARSTRGPFILPFRVWDHPRVCGEHERNGRAMLGDAGSSPRMRGAPRRVYRFSDAGGIIPAYAGSTFEVGEVCREERDHPRVCGEHLRKAGMALSAL